MCDNKGQNECIQNRGIGHVFKDILEARKSPITGQGHKGLYEILITFLISQKKKKTKNIMACSTINALQNSETMDYELKTLIRSNLGA